MALLMLLLLQFFYYSYIKIDLTNQGLGQAGITDYDSSQDDLTSLKTKYDLSCEGCNVIFINVELLRADHVDLINPDKNLTPNIDEFFKNGIIFSNTRSTAGETYLSITSTFTGVAPEINEHANKGVFLWPLTVPKDGNLTIDFVPTIPQVLKQNGYSTTSLNAGSHAGIIVHLDRGFDKYLEQYASKIYQQTDAVISEIQNSEKDSNKYFLHTHFNSLHYPFKLPLDAVSVMKPAYTFLDENTVVKNYLVPMDSNTKVSKGPFEKTPENNIMFELKLRNSDSNYRDVNYTFDDYAEMRKEYADEVTFVDNQLGKIFTSLEDNNYIDNTIVVLFSNHGDGLLDNYVPAHVVCYESCVYVPLIIRHPKIKEKIIVTDQLSLMDLAPTLYDMLNVKIDYNISGKSFYEELSKTGRITRPFVFGTISVSCTYVKKGDYKLIIGKGKIKELYNISLDPHETKNIYSENSVIAKELEAALDHQKIESLSLLEELKKRFVVSLESN